MRKTFPPPTRQPQQHDSLGLVEIVPRPEVPANRYRYNYSGLIDQLRHLSGTEACRIELPAGLTGPNKNNIRQGIMHACGNQGLAVSTSIRGDYLYVALKEPAHGTRTNR